MIEFRLIKIRILNFACYYGENIIDFTSKSKNNIYLFKLPNGYGKTSLFHAIKWGFYGEKIEYFKDSDKIDLQDFLNDRLDPAEDSCFVEIFFEYGKNVYELKRTYHPSVKKTSFFSLSKNSREIFDIDNAQEELNQIIPENFADFFMFDGEQLSKFMTAQKEFNFRDSIHQLLGLKQLRVLRDDLKKLQARYDNKLIQQTATSKDVETRRKTIKSLLNDINNFELKINNMRKDISKNDKIKDGLEEHRLRYEKLPKVMENLAKIIGQQAKISSGITILKNKLEENSKNFFLKFIEDDMSDFIDKNDEKLSELKDICGLTDIQAETQSAKEEILKKSIPICDVCGHKLKKDEIKELSDEQKKIRDSLDIFDKNKKGRNLLMNENSHFQSFVEISKENDFQKYLDDLQEKTLKFDDLEKKRKELEKESHKEEYGSLAKINREISLIEEENTTKKAKIKLLEQKIKGSHRQKEELTKEIRRLGHDDKITNKTTSLSAYVAKLIRLLDDSLDMGTQSKREQILKKSNELFNQITNKPDEYQGLEFENEESYTFVIKTKDNRTVTNPSKGEKQVLSMSFLLGLNQYTGRNNVILMDTPVASLDDVHSAGIGEALSKLKNQVIFLAQPQELSGDIYSNMKKGIEKEFIVKREDFKSIIEEVKS